MTEETGRGCFIDLQTNKIRGSHLFFLEQLLRARADLEMQSGRHDYDQEMNVYVAGLLNSLVSSSALLQGKPYLSSFDHDVRAWIEAHPGKRTEYNVYRDNADYGLMVLGLFRDHRYRSFYSTTVMPSVTDGEGRVSLYYELAASALSHLQGNTGSLVCVYEALAENVGPVVKIMRRVSGAYFQLLEHFSEGSVYHLESELAEVGQRELYSRKLDEFLKIYERYKENPEEEHLERLRALSQELGEMNPEFKFDLG